MLTTFPDSTYRTAKKCVEKGMLEVVLNLCELKEKETDEDVKEGAKRVLVMLAQSESGRKRVDGDGKLRKRVKRAAPEGASRARAAAVKEGEQWGDVRFV